MITNPFTQMTLNEVSKDLHEKGLRMASAQVGKRIKQYKTMPVGQKKDAMRKRINTGADWLGKKARGEV